MSVATVLSSSQITFVPQDRNLETKVSVLNVITPSTSQGRQCVGFVTCWSSLQCWNSFWHCLYSLTWLHNFFHTFCHFQDRRVFFCHYHQMVLSSLTRLVWVCHVIFTIYKTGQFLPCTCHHLRGWIISGTCHVQELISLAFCHQIQNFMGKWTITSCIWSKPIIS